MNTRTKGLLITIGGVLVLTPDSLLIRLVDADVWTVTFWRGLLFGTAILAGGFVFARQDFMNTIRHFGRPDLLYLGIHGIGAVAFVLSITLTTVANSLFILSTSPLWAAIASWIFLRERMGLKTWIAILLAAAGIAIIASGSFGAGVGAGAGNPLGDLAALVNAISMSLAFTVARGVKGRSLVPAMGLSGILAALIALPFAGSLMIPTESLPWLAIMSLIIVPFAFSMMTIGPRYIPAPEVSLIFLLEAVIAPIWVWLALAEHPGDRTLIGGTIVLVTLVGYVLLSARSGSQSRPNGVSSE